MRYMLLRYTAAVIAERYGDIMLVTAIDIYVDRRTSRIGKRI